MPQILLCLGLSSVSVGSLGALVATDAGRRKAHIHMWSDWRHWPQMGQPWPLPVACSFSSGRPTATSSLPGFRVRTGELRKVHHLCTTSEEPTPQRELKAGWCPGRACRPLLQLSHPPAGRAAHSTDAHPCPPRPPSAGHRSGGAHSCSQVPPLEQRR